jgi:hypothetical protein
VNAVLFAEKADDLSFSFVGKQFKVGARHPLISAEQQFISMAWLWCPKMIMCHGRGLIYGLEAGEEWC